MAFTQEARVLGVIALLSGSVCRAQTLNENDSPADGLIVASAESSESSAGPNVGTQPKPPHPIPASNPPTADAPAATPEAAESRLHLTLGVDYTSAYFSRGYRFEAAGWIAQPYADLSFDIIRLDDATISLTFGTWNSFHGKATDAATTDGFLKTWYENDLYVGAGLALGKWDIQARYYVESSPSDAWQTIEEFSASIAFDDSELLGDWSLKPTAVLYVETGENAIDGGRNGTNLQLGISPGFSFDAGALKDIEVTFPISIGLSLGNYYEGTGGENDFFGYASVGAKASLPLPLDKSWGGWTLTAGVQGLFLGDATSTFNKDDHTQVIGTIGVSVEF
jgi:hypothetical protein